MRKIVILMTLGFFTQLLVGQFNSFKPVGVLDLPYPAKDLTIDTGNNLLATCISADSIFVYQYDTLLKAWTNIIKHGGRPWDKRKSVVNSFVIRNTFYAVLSATNSNLVAVYKDSFGLKECFTFNTPSLGGLKNVHQSGDFLYFTGDLDSVINGTNVSRGIFSFDGINIQAINFLNKNVKVSCIYKDSIYLWSDSIVYKYDINSDTFNQSYSLLYNYGGISMTVNRNGLFIKIGNEIRKILNGVQVNSFEAITQLIDHRSHGTFAGTYKHMFSLDEKVYFIKRGTLFEIKGNAIKGIDCSRCLTYNGDSKFKYLNNQNFFIPDYNDSIPHVDSLNIATFNSDSLSYFGYDTVYLYGFIDYDRNGVLSTGDGHNPNIDYHHQIYTDTMGGWVKWATSLRGYVPYLMPNDREEAIGTVTLGDWSTPYCYEPLYKGFLQTDILTPGKTKDTLYFPFLQNLKNGALNPRVDLYRSQRARIGDTIKYSMNVLNQTCDKKFFSSTLKYVLPKNVTFIGSTPQFSARKGDTLVYYIDSSSSSVLSNINVDLRYDLSNFKIGDTLKHFAFLCSDSLSGSNQLFDKDSLCTRIVYSYDPNEKIAQPSGIVTKDVDKIKYTIHFQNEGNDVARRVIIKDTINTKMPVQWFRMINASHPYTVTIQNNIVTWTFNNINLPGKSENPKSSQGYVSFEAKVNTPMAIGDSIRNKASIYFDRNDAIITNYASIRREDHKDLIKTPHAIRFQDNLLVYPNPADQQVLLKNLTNSQQHITMYDIHGRNIRKIEIDGLGTQTVLLSQIPTGIYFLTLTGTGQTFKLLVE